VQFVHKPKVKAKLINAATMNIKLQIIIAFSFLYAIFETFMNVKQRQKKNVIISGDKLSIWILYISISIGYCLSFMVGATKIGRIYHWNTFFIIGFILIIVGLIIRVISIITLKQQFTYTVAKIEDHKLIDTGLYKSIRHPGYLGQLIIFLGISTTLSNWLAIIGMIVPVFLAYAYRINVEEKFMLTQMGQNYIDYQKRTKRLIPLIF
jgi:protein-S-isoprenylcysteine O-methyltransferase Ste14